MIKQVVPIQKIKKSDGSAAHHISFCKVPYCRHLTIKATIKPNKKITEMLVQKKIPEWTDPGSVPSLYLCCFFTEHGQLVCTVVGDRPKYFYSSVEGFGWHLLQLWSFPVDVVHFQFFNQLLSGFFNTYNVTVSVGWERQERETHSTGEHCITIFFCSITNHEKKTHEQHTQDVSSSPAVMSSKSFFPRAREMRRRLVLRK